MASLARVDVHHRGAPRCLLGLFDAAFGGLADWSEFNAEAQHLSVEVCGLSREDLRALIERFSLLARFRRFQMDFGLHNSP
jgi:hypothetical protein